MYRSPKASGGGSGFLMLLFLLWGAFYMAGCADVATGPEFDAFDDFEDPPTYVEDLDLTIDPDLVASAMAEIEAELGTNPSPEAQAELQTAASLFQSAQVEYTSGNYARVEELGEEARMALSRSVVRDRGSDGIEDRIARVDYLRERLQAGDTQDFDRPVELSVRLGDLVAKARTAQTEGNSVLAGARMVEAGQHTDRSRGRRHDRGEATEKAARLAVAMGNNAVELAVRLLGDRDVSERQVHLLETAKRLAAGAAEALENGEFRTAIMLGHKAVTTSLWAVIAPEVTEDEVRLIKKVAEEMLEAARASLEANPNDALQKLFNRAVHAYEVGVAKLEEGNLRGVSLLWNAAVVGAVIVG